MKAFFRSLLASILGFFIALGLIFLLFVGIIAAAVKGQKKEVKVKSNSVLVLKLDKPIPERPTENPFENFSAFDDDLAGPVSLKTILESIRKAKNDENVKGIMIEPEMLQASFPTLEEIRNELISFKESGKFIYSYAELYTQRNYYLASVADSIFINPEGFFSFAGFHSEQIFIKGMLEKLDIQANVIRAGKYKSAGEMFMYNEMSKENEAQLMAYLNSSWNFYLQQIAAARNVNVSELNTIANELKIRFPQDAVNYKLADKLYYRDEVLATLRKVLDVKENKKITEISIADYSKTLSDEKSNKNKIALIYAVGQIGGGEGDESSIGSEKLSEAIRKARTDDNVKAIVLRINSPGGSALASDVIWREINLTRGTKPIIASMGDLAASGGYYIAAPCDTIVCQPNTITGSIGVFGIIPNFEKFWNNKLGITWDRARTGPYADLGNPNRKMTPEEVAIIQTYIDSTYITFKRRVATGRGLQLDFVDSIAQGRIYSGLQAKENGLVDIIGSMDDAIALAAQKAGLEKDDYSLKVLPEYKIGFSKLLGSMVMARSIFMNKELEKTYQTYKSAENMMQYSGVLMLYPYNVNVY